VKAARASGVEINSITVNPRTGAITVAAKGACAEVANGPISTPSLRHLRRHGGQGVELKGIHKVRAKSRTYWYAWRGGPRRT
jgi:hypothetical protein